MIDRWAHNAREYAGTMLERTTKAESERDAYKVFCTAYLKWAIESDEILSGDLFHEMVEAYQTLETALSTEPKEKDDE